MVPGKRSGFGGLYQASAFIDPTVGNNQNVIAVAKMG
jgi:hypothetical protein